MAAEFSTSAFPYLPSRLVIPRRWHQQILEQLVQQPERMILMRTGAAREMQDQSQMWLAQRLADRAELAAAGPSDRFFAIRGHDGENGPMPYVESNLNLHPQAVAGELFYGTGAWLGRLWGFVRAGGGERWRALERLDLPGPGMQSLPLLATPHEAARLTREAQRVQHRTLAALGAQGSSAWLSMRRRPLVLVGASGNGSRFADLAGCLGLDLVIVDKKSVDLGHLGRVFLFHESDIGRPKAEVLAERLRERGPTSGTAAPVVSNIDSPAGLEALKRGDVLVDCVDTDAARVAVGMAAVALHKVQLSISCGVRHDAEGRRTLGADVRLILPGDRCLHCCGHVHNYAEAIQDLASPREMVDLRRARENPAERGGSLASLNSEAVGMAMRWLEDLHLERIQASRWQRIQYDEEGRLSVVDPVLGPAGGRSFVMAGHGQAAGGPPAAPACRCATAGGGDRFLNHG